MKRSAPDLHYRLVFYSISTGTHGSGFNHQILSSHTQELLIISSTPGAPLITCSRTTNPKLFLASLCGLGLTGLIVEVTYKVEEAFRLRQVSVPMKIEDILMIDGKTNKVLEKTEKTPLLNTSNGNGNGGSISDNNNNDKDLSQGLLSEIAQSSQHSRLWWFPQTGGVVVARADRVYTPAPKPAFSLFGNLWSYHFTHLLLFLSWCWLLPTKVVGGWAWWLQNGKEERVDEGYNVFCFDCLVSVWRSSMRVKVEREFHF